MRNLTPRNFLRNFRKLQQPAEDYANQQPNKTHSRKKSLPRQTCTLSLKVAQTAISTSPMPSRHLCYATSLRPTRAFFMRIRLRPSHCLAAGTKVKLQPRSDAISQPQPQLQRLENPENPQPDRVERMKVARAQAAHTEPARGLSLQGSCAVSWTATA